MAEVYKRVNNVGPEKVVRYVARAPEVRRALDAEARKILSKAEAKLAAVRADPGYTGDLNVVLRLEAGRIDHYVVMDDPPDTTSPGAAMSIEYGHYKGKRGLPNREFIPGKWILHDAIGRPHA